jgi:hypothetical protein
MENYYTLNIECDPQILMSLVHLTFINYYVNI